MAYATHTDKGVPIWKPDRITLRGKLRLDPALSPMENLFNVIRVQTSIWLTKYKVYSLEGPEEVDDLFSSLMLRIFLDVRRKVWDGTYRRDLSLYLNVRSSAFSVTGHLLKSWSEEREKRKETLHMDQLLLGESDSAPKTLGDTISYEEGHLSYLSKSEINKESKRRQRQRHNARSLADPSINTKKREAMLKRMQKVREAKEHQDEYDRYVSECEFFGLTDRLDYESFIRQNYK